MPAAVEEFTRFADFLAEPILLVSGSAHLCAANCYARRAVLYDAPVGSEDSLFQFIADAHEKVLDYLKACSRSAHPLPGMLSFRGSHAADAGAQFRCAGSAFQSRDENGSPLVLLRLAPKEISNRFIALNQQIGQLRVEVSRRMQAERAAFEQRELLRVTLSSIGDAVIASDVAGNIAFMNPIAESHTGWTLEEALGQPLENVFFIRNEDSRKPLESPVQKVLRSGRVAALANHTVLVRKDQTELPIDDSGAPIRDSEGNLLGVIVVFRDISQRRKLERELIGQTQALREADRLKDEFLAMLAHELRNPLAPLRNCVQILRSQASSASSASTSIDVDALAAMMERQTRQLTRLVEDLLDVARITRGAIPLKLEPVRLRIALEHAIETSKPLIDQHRHRLHVDLPPDGLIIEADLIRLTQILANVLTNAAKFTEPGGEIFVSAWEEDGRAMLSVRDTGIGLEPESLPHVFEMFRQENKSLDRTQGGLGVGLTIVKKLLDMHGGDITAHSEGAGKGAEFRLWLPSAGSASSPSRPAESMTEAHLKTRVLIVDDNADGADSLAILLQMWGCAVRVAREGHGAIEDARRFQPDIILLDIGLPGMDGYEVARQLRLLPKVGGARVIAVTGYGSELDRARSQAAGFDFHLTKPVDLDRLKPLLALQDFGRG